ncbi:MAG: HAD family hydrolase [Desulfovibrionaceae bacterium]|nr:HAD family hydrolase [Desulfovibrionaceae bacterium]
MKELFARGLRGVIFDCDGVMIDSTDANRAFYNLILAHYGLPPMTPDQEEYSFMASSAQALERLLPEHLHAEIPRIGRDVVNYRREIMPLVKIFPGFLDFAAFLHNHGIRMAVLTNRTAGGMKAVLDFFSLPPYFDPVVTASSGFCKPSPKGAQLILEAWGCQPAEALLVGDSEADLAAARAAGIPFAASPAAPAGLGGDIRMSSYADLRRDLEPVLDRTPL